MIKILPAIDLYEGKAVRLAKGDYNQMKVYSDEPWKVAKYFRDEGAEYIHIVDLEGARDGGTPNIDTVKRIADTFGGFSEIGGGVRSTEVIETYLGAGISRVILGTAAAKDPVFLREAITRFGDRVAVGADLKDGEVAVKGWTEGSGITCDEFFCMLDEIGADTVICTDVSKDGMLAGTNLELYRRLTDTYSVKVIASGGVTDENDIMKLCEIGVDGAILGRAVYEGRLKVSDAIRIAKEYKR